MNLPGARERVASGLAELHRLAPEREAWSEAWQRARAWTLARGTAAGLDFELDRAGNQWFSAGPRPYGAIVIGGHLDTTPEQPWGADGSLSLLAGLEVASAADRARSDRPGLRVVNWADGAGTRFGRPFGASAAAGRLGDWYAAEELLDATGTSLREAAHSRGVQPKLAQAARRLLAGTRAYIELAGEPLPGEPGGLAVAARALGVERCRLRWTFAEGAGARAPGSELRRASDRFAGELRREVSAAACIARIGRAPGDMGEGQAQQELWLQHADADVLEATLDRALELSERVAIESGASVEWRRLWRAPPVAFDGGLTDLACRLLPGCDPLADGGATALQGGASELARAGVPSAVLTGRPGHAGWAAGTIAQALQAFGGFAEAAAPPSAGESAR